MKRYLHLILASVFILSLLLLFEVEITQNSLATDSGFDTSYDSGGGISWDSGSSWDYGTGNSYHSSSSSSSEGDIFIAIFFVVILISYLIYFTIKVKRQKQNEEIENNYQNRTEGIHSDVTSSMFEDKKSQKKDIPTKEEKELLKNAYEIYIEVQKAWMNFDYKILKTLVTDELYNTYKNQLDTLSLKDQKNIMKDFQLRSSSILSKREHQGITTLKVKMIVSFYDYIVDSEEKVVRGKKNKKVEMTYLLTFVYEEMAKEKCPNCGSELKDKTLVCPYCHTKMQAVTREMRLSKKECLKQR